ncbi:MAG: hypothetical protein WDW38_005322 [Sanguina aurantia]
MTKRLQHCVKALEQAQAAKRAEDVRAAERARLREEMDCRRADANKAAAAMARPAAAAPHHQQQQQQQHPTSSAQQALHAAAAGVPRGGHNVVTGWSEGGGTQGGTGQQQQQLQQPQTLPLPLPAPAPPDAVNDKLKRAEMKRKEDEEKRRAELEAKSRAKEERSKRAVAAALVLQQQQGMQQRPAAVANMAPGCCRCWHHWRRWFGIWSKHLVFIATPTGVQAATAAAPSSSIPAAAPVDTEPPFCSFTVTAATAAAYLTPASTPILRGPKPAAHATPSASNMAPRAGASGLPLGAPTPHTAMQPPRTRTAEAALEARNIQALERSPNVMQVKPRFSPFGQPAGCRPSKGVGAANLAKLKAMGKGMPALSPQFDYQISPYRPDSDDDAEEEAEPKKPVPGWASSARILEAIRTQAKIDPDILFDTRNMRTCVLEEIFPNIVRNARTGVHKHKKWAKRGSSGDWQVDGTTAQEQAAYKRAMGWR